MMLCDHGDYADGEGCPECNPATVNESLTVRQEAQGAPAAPEYPIRALVKVGAIAATDLPPGTLLQVRQGKFGRGQVPNGPYGQFDFVDRYYSKTTCTTPGDDWTWWESELIIDPTPAQIAEERAKAGLPAADAEGVPERSEGSPSQVIELDSLLADYGLAFQQPGWDWRVKLDAAKAKIIEWVARSQTLLSLPAPTVPKGGCNWHEFDTDTDTWKTSCGQEFTMTGGKPLASGFRFCTYCGKPLVEVQIVDEEGA